MSPTTDTIALIGGLIGGALCVATLVVSVRVFDDEPVLQLVVTFTLTFAAMGSLYNASFHGVRLWTGRRQNRARKRARALLLRLLTPEQKEQYLAGLPITVPVIDGDQKVGRAQIAGGISGVVWYPASDAPRAWRRQHGRQCVYVQGSEPSHRASLCPEDDTIGLLLWLRADPAGLLAVTYARDV